MLRAKKRLGQHFLRSRRIVERILAAAELKPSDVVLEVGPGTGVLTFELVEKVGHVIAVEKDRELAARLQEQLSARGFENVKVIPADILKIKTVHLDLKPYVYKLIGNLPYYIASAIIRRFLEKKPKPKLMIVMVQKEVGERIAAKPPKMSLLSVATQVYGKPEIVTRVPKEAFWPKPKVDGVVVKITPFKTPLFEKKELTADAFFRVLKIAFAAPRKQLGGVLSRKFGRERAGHALRAAKISLDARPEEVSVGQWLTIAPRLSLR